MGEPIVEAEEQLRDALGRALAAGTSARDRLTRTGVRVRFRVRGGHRPVTLLLDQRPPTLGEPDAGAEVELVLSPDQAALLARGTLSMPAALACGGVQPSGPVRRYLEVEPVLRGLLGSRGRPGVSGADSAAHGSVARGAVHQDSLDPDWLAIETRGLTRRFRHHPALTGADLQIPEGTISVILGSSGAGKSQLVQHIIGLEHPDAGDVLVRGRRLAGMRRSELLALRTEIGVMFPDGAPLSSMNLFDNVAFPLRQHTVLDDAAVEEMVMRQLDRVGLASAAPQLPEQLSGGMRRRAGLARALVLEPSLLICDEPEFGLSGPHTRRVGDLLLNQHAEVGGTIVVITRDLGLAVRIADHVSILAAGRVVASHMTEAIPESENPFLSQFLSVARETGRLPHAADHL